MGCCSSNLSKSTFENTELFEFRFTVAKVIKIYDGDTVWLAFYNNKTINKVKARLYGIDTPELKPLLNTPNRDVIIEKAIKSKNKLIDLIDNKIVDIECKGTDKYGRLLVIIKYNDININEYLVENKYAVRYFGGTK